jgi:S1-C subfamily serine protease
MNRLFKEKHSMSQSNILKELSDAMANAAEKASASTVLVNGRRRLPASGIVYTPELVITANHVLEREEDIPVLLPDGKELSARLAGRDPESDLAVLSLEGGNLVVAEPALQEAQVGQITLAIGRPTQEGIQASLGVVSAIGGPVRMRRGGLLERYIRTDAIPYPGFSGGPLIDSTGRVLGMNTSGLTRGSSLAIPVGFAWQIAESLAEHGSVRRGYLGVRSQPVEIVSAQQAALERTQGTGLLLVSVERDSPAEVGGLMVGDIIIGFAGEPVSDPDDLLTRLAGEVVGQPTAIEILRGDRQEKVTVTIGERK